MWRVSSLKEKTFKLVPELADLPFDAALPSTTTFTAFTALEASDDIGISSESESPSNMIMQLRKAANHTALLSRLIYPEPLLRELAQVLHADESHVKADVNLIFEDLSVMTDHQVHTTCSLYEVSAYG
ncbi:unnamed protein product [Protopolystoma xenopodis]|uniref:Uncharacterized protein n=1 Tax=Protopolystoma xenopodis TaxID=117903 RepID=A0A3S5AMJ6_9PLAT|nr:unnamed protein product [Protopolystoma xenopodis]